MIDKDKLFELFGSAAEEADEEVDQPFSDLDEPFNKIGMFVKLIINHLIFHQKLSRFLKEETSNTIDLESTKEASAFAIFNRAWFYIKDIDLKDKNHCQAVMKFKSEPFLNTLEEAIIYFEGVENYERCGHLYEIQQLKKKSY
jgi:hypothetical protein